jgi:hypothetical protein
MTRRWVQPIIGAAVAFALTGSVRTAVEVFVLVGVLQCIPILFVWTIR